jgi:hypothetical protein
MADIALSGDFSHAVAPNRALLRPKDHLFTASGYVYVVVFRP